MAWPCPALVGGERWGRATWVGSPEQSHGGQASGPMSVLGWLGRSAGLCLASVWLPRHLLFL